MVCMPEMTVGREDTKSLEGFLCGSISHRKEDPSAVARVTGLRVLVSSSTPTTMVPSLTIMARLLCD